MVDTVHLGTGEKPRQRSETHPQTTVQIELQCTEQGRNDSRIGRGDLPKQRWRGVDSSASNTYRAAHGIRLAPIDRLDPGVARGDCLDARDLTHDRSVKN